MLRHWVSSGLRKVVVRIKADLDLALLVRTLLNLAPWVLVQAWAAISLLVDLAESHTHHRLIPA